ncbi:MAG: glycosyltransferase family 39 protein [Chloroflexota bacterium]|nr:glycosyltransferase family 39 protein [Chloroflexota bacterium]
MDERPTGLSKPCIRNRVLIGVLVAVIALAYLMPRLIALDRLVTVDESFWLGRSANFYAGLRGGEFARTYQHAHPGVTIMWAGTAGFLLEYPSFPEEHPGQVAKEYAIHEDLQALGHNALDLLIAGRAAKIVLQAVAFAIGFWLAWPVFGRLPTVVATLLLAFDPFLIGHDRLLHVDGVCALTAYVSLIAFVRFLQDQTRTRFLLLSGVFAALAWLTRTPALLIAGVVGLALLVVAWGQLRSRRVSLRQAALGTAGSGLLWGVAAMLTTFLAWPALWSAPGMVARRMFAYSIEAAGEGHEAPIFFNGVSYRGDPGLLYYPVSLLWRLTPVTLAGLAIVLVAVAVRSRIVVPRHLRAPLAILATFVLLYVLAMSLGAKKFDRYALPAYPALDLIAAVGIVGAGRLLAAQGRRVACALAWLAIAGAVLGQLASALTTAPYYLPYFNPLVGGTAGAEDMLLLGWGEGMDQVADFILSQPGGDHAVVHTSNARVSLTYLMSPTTTVVTTGYRADMPSMVAWAHADYYVAYVSQWQRDAFSRPIDYLSQFPPLKTVRFGGVDFARIYDLNAIPPPPELTNDHACAFRFGDDVQLVAYEDVRLEPTSEANLHRLTFFFLSGPQARDSYDVRLELLPRSSQLEPLAHTLTLRPNPSSGRLSAASVEVELPGKRSIKSYFPLVSVLDPATGRPIEATQIISGVIGTKAVFTSCA